MFVHVHTQCEPEESDTQWAWRRVGVISLFRVPPHFNLFNIVAYLVLACLEHGGSREMQKLFPCPSCLKLYRCPKLKSGAGKRSSTGYVMITIIITTKWCNTSVPPHPLCVASYWKMHGTKTYNLTLQTKPVNARLAFNTAQIYSITIGFWT